MKTSRVCYGMLFYENDAFKCLKTAKNTNSTCITCTIVPGLVELFLARLYKVQVEFGVRVRVTVPLTPLLSFA